MTGEETAEKLFAIEDELDLFYQRAGGVFFWDIVRRRVYSDAWVRTGSFYKRPPRRRTLFSLIRSAYSIIKSMLFYNPFFASRADILVVGGNRRQLEEDGFYHDILCDPLIERLEQEGVRCMLIERPSLTQGAREPVKTRRVVHLVIIEVCVTVLDYLRRVRLHLSCEERTFLAMLEERIYKELKIRIGIERLLIEELQKRHNAVPLCKLFLRRTSPKAVIVAKAVWKLPFVIACREAGIPVIELQHGGIYRDHVVYSYEGPRRSAQYAPDYFFAFGDFWKRMVKFPQPPERVYSVGYPYHERELEKYKNVKQKNQILFLSQPVLKGVFSRYAVEFAKEWGNTYHLVYKLHPSENVVWKKLYPWLVDSGVQVMKDGERSLYELFAESKVQVGVYSTSIYEGLGFGLHTYLLDMPGIKKMSHLLEHKYALKVGSVRELRALLEKQEPAKRVPGEEFFRRNSLERMACLVKELCEYGVIRKAESS